LPKFSIIAFSSLLLGLEFC